MRAFPKSFRCFCARTHTHQLSLERVGPPGALCPDTGGNRPQVLEAAAQTMLGVAALHSMQAYELLCLDMPAEQAVLAAAAPPGLLDAARAVWAKAVLRASFSSSHCVFAALSWVLLLASCRWSLHAQVQSD